MSSRPAGRRSPSACRPTRSPWLCSGSPVRSPGMMTKHYAPRSPLELAADDGRTRVERLVRQGERVGWLTWAGVADVPGVVRTDLPVDPAGYAARLYAALHDLDAAGV